jgi:hypothetical protein
MKTHLNKHAFYDIPAGTPGRVTYTYGNGICHWQCEYNGALRLAHCWLEELEAVDPLVI